MNELIDDGGRVQGEAAVGEAAFGRRHLLRAGGLAAVAAAVLAACGIESPEAGDQVPQAGIGSTPTSAPPAVLSDATLLRTAGSVARAVVEAHTQLLDGGKLTTPALVEAAELFVAHHEAHIEVLDSLIERADAEVYDEPNPLLVSRQLAPGLEALTDETSAVALALQMESVAADTYQLFTPMLSTGALKLQMMQLGGVVGRHAAVLAMNLPYGEVVEVADTTVLPEGATTTTTTTVPGTIVPDTVYAVPGPFGSTTVGVGPSFYV